MKITQFWIISPLIYLIDDKGDLYVGEIGIGGSLISEITYHRVTLVPDSMEKARGQRS